MHQKTTPFHPQKIALKRAFRGMVSIRSATDYSPFGVQLENRNFLKTGLAEDYRMGFQGQEEDDEVKGEGNSVNYKYRMHDPRLGRFFAVDPLATKYPNLSPYHFCNSNPITFKEFDGKDYGIYVDHVNKTITIKATYYAVSADAAEAKDAVNFWNSQNGQFTYVIGKKENAVIYDVKFELSVIDVSTLPNPNNEPEWGVRDLTYDSDKSGEANTYKVEKNNSYIGDDHGTTETAAGIGRGLSRIFVLTGKQEQRKTGSHEVGHTLGLHHWSKGLMKKGAVRLDNETSITIGMISKILFRGGIGKIVSNALDYDIEPSKAGHNTPNVTTTDGTAPTEFSTGEVKKKKN